MSVPLLPSVVPTSLNTRTQGRCRMIPLVSTTVEKKVRVQSSLNWLTSSFYVFLVFGLLWSWNKERSSGTVSHHHNVFFWGTPDKDWNKTLGSPFGVKESREVGSTHFPLRFIRGNTDGVTNTTPSLLYYTLQLYGVLRWELGRKNYTSETYSWTVVILTTRRFTD